MLHTSNDPSCQKGRRIFAWCLLVVCYGDGVMCGRGNFSCITSTSLTVGPSIKWFIVPQSTIIISSSHTDIDQDDNKQNKILWTQICQMKCYNLYIWRLFELHELSIRDHFLLLSYTTFFWGTLLVFKLFKSLKVLRKISFILLHPFSHFA